MYKLLLLEDEAEIGETLKQVLEFSGYEVDWFTTGDDVIKSVINESNPYDLMILDVTLKKTSPPMHISNGFEVARVISGYKQIPYMFLTSRSEGPDIMHGLDSGADDYVKKPYEMTELLARIRAILRRYENKSESNPSQEVVFHGIKLDLLTHKAYVDDKRVHLTNQQFELLNYFMQNQKKILTKEELYKNIWGYDPSTAQVTNTLEVNIRRLRATIGVHYIKTVRGKGYILETPTAV